MTPASSGTAPDCSFVDREGQPLGYARNGFQVQGPYLRLIDCCIAQL